jgi:ribosomal protein S12
MPFYFYNIIIMLTDYNQVIRNTKENHFKRWTDEDISKLDDMIKNKTILTNDIASEFKRSKNAIRKQIQTKLYKMYNENQDDIMVDNGLCCINLNKQVFIQKYNQYYLNRDVNKEIKQSIKEQNKPNTKTIQEQINDLNKKLDLIIQKLDTLEVE